MDEQKFLAERFEANRAHLRAVAYRMLGSRAEVDDAVQEAWLRLSRSDTVDGREPRRLADDGRRRGSASTCCGPQVAARGAAGPHVPEPAVATRSSGRRMLADSVGAALLVVLETLAPAERLAFVLHDMFAVPFEQIAPIVGRSLGGDAPTREPGAPAGAGRPSP